MQMCDCHLQSPAGLWLSVALAHAMLCTQALLVINWPKEFQYHAKSGVRISSKSGVAGKVSAGTTSSRTSCTSMLPR